MSRSERALRSRQRLSVCARLTITSALPVAALVTCMLRPSAAFAGVGVGVAPTYPALVQVGTTNVPVGLSITNTSTPPESGGTLTLTLIKHTPSCGADSPVPCTAADADPGVFLVKGPATGMDGTACAGMTFTIGTPDAVTEEVEFIPNSSVILAPTGSGPTASCTINFFVDVLKLPSKDAAESPGMQTNQLGRVRGIASVNGVQGTGTGSGVTTVINPTPTPTHTATPTPTDTPTPTPTNTPTDTPTPTSTPTFTETPTRTPSPTMTPGPNDCCKCEDDNTCAAPSAGSCNLVCPNETPPVIVLNAVCLPPAPPSEGTPSTGGCATFTATVTPTATPTPLCLGTDRISELIPGYCGGLPPDCLTELCIPQPPPRKPNGLPDNSIACKDDDPICDFGTPTGDRTCTFMYQVCLNLMSVEKRFPCTKGAGPIIEVRLLDPPEGNPKPGLPLENRDAFEAALLKLGGVIGGFKKRSVVFSPPLGDTVCTDLVPFKVRVKQSPKTLAFKPGKSRLWYKMFRLVGPFDGDHFFFRCNP